MIKSTFIAYSLFFLCCLTACGLPSSSNKKGDTNAAFDLNTANFTYLNGENTTIADLKGKPIFLNFWATWCGPCVKEMPDLQKAHDILVAEDFEFIVASYEGTDLIQKFADARSFTFPYAKTKEDILTALGIRSIPTTYIINTDGKVVKKYIGAREWAEDEILNEIRAAVR